MTQRWAIRNPRLGDSIVHLVREEQYIYLDDYLYLWYQGTWYELRNNLNWNNPGLKSPNNPSLQIWVFSVCFFHLCAVCGCAVVSCDVNFRCTKGAAGAKSRQKGVLCTICDGGVICIHVHTHTHTHTHAHTHRRKEKCCAGSEREEKSEKEQEKEGEISEMCQFASPSQLQP